MAENPSPDSSPMLTLIFDYQSPMDFKFAGVNISIDKLQMGHRDADGWHVDVQLPAQLKPDRDYNMLLSLHGHHRHAIGRQHGGIEPMCLHRRIDALTGLTVGLNTGMVGIGAENSKRPD